MRRLSAALCQSKAGGFIGRVSSIGALRSALIGDLLRSV